MPVEALADPTVLMALVEAVLVPTAWVLPLNSPWKLLLLIRSSQVALAREMASGLKLATGPHATYPAVVVSRPNRGSASLLPTAADHARDPLSFQESATLSHAQVGLAEQEELVAWEAAQVVWAEKWLCTTWPPKRSP